MARRFALASGIVLALALLALPGWIALNRRDAPAPDDRDLRLARPLAAVSDNGFDRWTEASRAARLPRGTPAWQRFDAFRAGETWEPQWIAELVAQNAAATELLGAGLASSRFAFPPVEGALERREEEFTLLRVRGLIALEGARARILLREGRSREAIEAAALGLRAGKQLSAAEGLDRFGIYMARLYQTVSLDDLEHAVRGARLAPDDARSLVRLLEATRWHAEDWQRVWALEYEQVVEQIDVLRQGPNGLAWPIGLLPADYLWHRNRTAAALADLYRDQDRKSAAFCANAGLLRAGAVRPRRHGLAQRLAPNALGWMVVDAIRARDYDGLQLARCQLETRVSLVEVLTAAKAWSDAEGALPERLDQLVPRYLDALPLDRYDGSPLRYSRSAPVVYSVGRDYTDTAPAVPSAADQRDPGISLAW